MVRRAQQSIQCTYTPNQSIDFSLNAHARNGFEGRDRNHAFLGKKLYNRLRQRMLRMGLQTFHRYRRRSVHGTGGHHFGFSFGEGSGFIQHHHL